MFKTNRKNYTGIAESFNISFLLISPTSMPFDVIGTLRKLLVIRHLHTSARLSSLSYETTSVVITSPTVSELSLDEYSWFCKRNERHSMSFSEMIPTIRFFLSTTGMPVILYFTIISIASTSEVFLVTVISFVDIRSEISDIVLFLTVSFLFSWQFLQQSNYRQEPNAGLVQIVTNLLRSKKNIEFPNTNTKPDKHLNKLLKGDK